MTQKIRLLALGMGLGLLGWASGCAFYHEGGRTAYSFGKAQINLPCDPIQPGGLTSKGEKKSDGGAPLVASGNLKEQGPRILQPPPGSIKKAAVSEGDGQLPDNIVVVPEKGPQSRIGNAIRNLFDRQPSNPGQESPVMVPNEFPLPPATTTPNITPNLPTVQGNQTR